MNILITGAAGFIGTNVTKRLLHEGHTVIGLDNFITSDPTHITDCSAEQNYTFIRHDIIHPFNDLFPSQPIDQIYHLACPTGVPNLTPLAEEMLQTCSVGTKNVLEFARTKHCQIIFSSSSEVYGDPLVSPQSESYTGNVDTKGVRSPYEEGKRFSESLMSMYARKYGVVAKTVRVFNTYGPYMSESDTRVIPNFFHQAFNGEDITMHGTGEQKRTFCYVDDLVEGLIMVLEKGESGEVYNIGSDSQITIRDLATMIIRMTSSNSRINQTERPHHDHQSRLPDLQKIQKLGWSPKTDLETGLRKTLTWFGF